ncbi:MAG: LptF/LptG family permease [Planctomycetaceae bacterium]
MNLLQRYILGELLRVFCLLVIVLTVMLVFVGLLREASEQGLGLSQIVQIMPFVVPSMLPFTIPATLLLTVTVVYGRMAGDLEITAAKAAGLNPLSLLMPAFGLGLVLAIGSFGLTNYAIPWAVDNIERIVTQAIEDIFLDRLAAQHFVSEPERGFSITVEDIRDRILINPTFRYRNGEHEQVTLNARAAKIRFDMEERKVRVLLKDAHASVPGKEMAMALDEKELAFEMDEHISRRNARHLTIASIEEKIAEYRMNLSLNQFQRDQEAAMLLMTGDFQQLASKQIQTYGNYQLGADYATRSMTTEMHSRYAMAGSCLFFALIGGPFAIYQARRQFITAFIMCFLPILLVYYPITFLMGNLGKIGSVDPTWGMWIPNAILAVAGWFVLRRVVRH